MATYTLKEMKNACKQAGIKGISKLSKQELLDFINNSDRAQEIRFYLPKPSDNDNSDSEEPTEGRYCRQIDYGDFVDGSYIVHPITEVLDLDELPEDAIDRGYAPAEKLRTGLSSLIRTEQKNPEKPSVPVAQFIETDEDPTTENTDNPFVSRFTSGDVVPFNKPTTPTPPATPNIKPLPSAPSAKPQPANVPAAAEWPEWQEFITVFGRQLKNEEAFASLLPLDVFDIASPLDAPLDQSDWLALDNSYFQRNGEILYRWYHGTSEWKLQRAILSNDDRLCNCKNGENNCLHKRAAMAIKDAQRRKDNEMRDRAEWAKKQDLAAESRSNREETLEWLRQGSRFGMASQLAHKRHGYTKPFFDLPLSQLVEIKSEIEAMEKAIV